MKKNLQEMEMAKIKPPKKKEEPPPIPKFVPLKPDPSLLNAPVRIPGQATAAGAKTAGADVEKSAAPAVPVVTTAAITTTPGITTTTTTNTGKTSV